MNLYLSTTLRRCLAAAWPDLADCRRGSVLLVRRVAFNPHAYGVHCAALLTISLPVRFWVMYANHLYLPTTDYGSYMDILYVKPYTRVGPYSLVCCLRSFARVARAHEGLPAHAPALAVYGGICGGVWCKACWLSLGHQGHTDCHDDVHVAASHGVGDLHCLRCVPYAHHAAGAVPRVAQTAVYVSHHCLPLVYVDAHLVGLCAVVRPDVPRASDLV